MKLIRELFSVIHTSLNNYLVYVLFAKISEWAQMQMKNNLFIFLHF